MRSSAVMAFTVLALLAQRGSCQSFTGDLKSLQGLRRISSVSVTITEMTSSTGTRLLTSGRLGKAQADMEAQIKSKLRAAHIAVVDGPQMTPEAGRLSVSVILMSYQPRRYSFTAFCHLGQQMTLVRTGASGCADTYEGQAMGAMPDDDPVSLHRVVIGLADGFVRAYTAANAGQPKLAEK